MWPEHEADHSPASIAEVKNEWSYTSILPYTFVLKTQVLTPRSY